MIDLPLAVRWAACRDLRHPDGRGETHPYPRRRGQHRCRARPGRGDHGSGNARRVRLLDDVTASQARRIALSPRLGIRPSSARSTRPISPCTCLPAASSHIANSQASTCSSPYRRNHGNQPTVHSLTESAGRQRQSGRNGCPVSYTCAIVRSAGGPERLENLALNELWFMLPETLTAYRAVAARAAARRCQWLSCGTTCCVEPWICPFCRNSYAPDHDGSGFWLSGLHGRRSYRGGARVGWVTEYLVGDQVGQGGRTGRCRAG